VSLEDRSTGEKMNRIVPFVLTGLLSSVLTLVVVNWYLGASGMDDIGMLKARADLAVEEQQKLADEADVHEKGRFSLSGPDELAETRNLFGKIDDVAGHRLPISLHSWGELPNPALNPTGLRLAG
jgi:hypothetical protein